MALQKNVEVFRSVNVTYWKIMRYYQDWDADTKTYTLSIALNGYLNRQMRLNYGEVILTETVVIRSSLSLLVGIAQDRTSLLYTILKTTDNFKDAIDILDEEVIIPVMNSSGWVE